MFHLTSKNFEEGGMDTPQEGTQTGPQWANGCLKDLKGQQRGEGCGEDPSRAGEAAEAAVLQIDEEALVGKKN